MNTYAVAMSGGVDSSTTAAILKSEGHDVFGVTMLTRKTGCEQIISDSQKIAEYLKIKHYIYDVTNEFQKNVIEYFINSYLNGFTPNPCAICNRDIKLNLLLKFALQKGANYLATGHYANMKVINDEVYLKESDNKLKDQSYFLSLTSKDNLKHIVFPLSRLQSKQETRNIAKKFGLENFNKKDSQDICFISTKDYVSYIKNNSNITETIGEIIFNGKCIAKHKGLLNYTIGQRRGLNISHYEPLYVININNKLNQLYVGNKKDLIRNKFKVCQMNWLINKSNCFKCNIKIRAGKIKFKAIIYKISQDTIEVELLEINTIAICPEQICALYSEENIVYGAGIISL